MKKYFIHTDGGARGNPGEGAVGAVIKTENHQLLFEISQRLGKTTNNIAEYTAVIFALEKLKENVSKLQCDSETIFQFFLDSKLVVNQLNGLYKVKENHLRELVLKVRSLEQEIGGKIYYSLIPREKNFEADRLVNKALDNR
ncbi:ribonuclease HI family protein [Candidatus Gottesmanbacteria bacterium]|nr:ribonuclease HI family protein [Candidatus Gottesmanbacteria bacterium]